MQHPANNLVHSGLKRQRTVTVTFVAAIHALAIYGLVAALVPQARIFPPGSIEVIDTKDKETKTEHAPPPIALVRPSGPTAKRPIFDIDNASPQGPTGTTGTGGDTHLDGANDLPPRAIAGTHTTPPYPATSLRLGEQGTVRLLLMVGDDGTVVSAIVEKTSGSYALDQAAIEWVRKHWRYHPGVQNGAPAAMTTEADIRFDIRHAR